MKGVAVGFDFDHTLGIDHSLERHAFGDLAESSLAELVPLWRTVREAGVTALITPALDYVGGLELGGIDPRFAGEGPIASIGEGLRGLVGSLDDGVTLHFLYRVTSGAEAQIREYEQIAGSAAEPALRCSAEARSAAGSSTPTPPPSPKPPTLRSSSPSRSSATASPGAWRICSSSAGSWAPATSGRSTTSCSTPAEPSSGPLRP